MSNTDIYDYRWKSRSDCKEHLLQEFGQKYGKNLQENVNSKYRGGKQFELVCEGSGCGFRLRARISKGNEWRAIKDSGNYSTKEFVTNLNHSSDCSSSGYQTTIKDARKELSPHLPMLGFNPLNQKRARISKETLNLTLSGKYTENIVKKLCTEINKSPDKVLKAGVKKEFAINSFQNVTANASVVKNHTEEEGHLTYASDLRKAIDEESINPTTDDPFEDIWPVAEMYSVLQGHFSFDDAAKIE